MSMCTCDQCGHIFDSDVDENCFVGDIKIVCEKCRELMQEAGPELFVALEWLDLVRRNLQDGKGCGNLEFEDCIKTVVDALAKAKGDPQ